MALDEKFAVAKPQHLRHARQTNENCRIVRAGKSNSAPLIPLTKGSTKGQKSE